MDERLEKALDFSNYMTTLNNQKRLLIENFNQNSIYYYQGGQFTVNKEIICFCEMISKRGQKSVILIDDNEMPVEIIDLNKFVDDLFDVYFTASNTFLTEYNKLKKSRTVEKIVEL